MKINRRKKSKRGFTLMEILLVMAILIVLGSLVTFSFITIRKNSMEDACRLQIKAFEGSCDQYFNDVGQMPTQLTDLRNQPQNLAVPEKWRGPYLEEDVPPDPWGNQYEMSVSTDQYGNPLPVITSNGTDGVKGTADDISNVRTTGTSG